jgi:deoxyribonuclease-1
MRILIAALLFLPFAILAHSGGQDNNGGHLNRTTGEYHCHSETCDLPSELPSDDSLDWPDGDIAASATTIAGSWGTAKKWSKNIVYQGRDKTFYCGCTYSASQNKDGVDLSSCDYEMSGVLSYHARADDLEQEHVVPASLMPARQFACWNGDGLPKCSKGSRSCCERYDLNARAMIFDLHNIVPSVGQVNALRSNKRYGEIAGEDLKLACDFEWTKAVAEPPLSKRGEVARIWLYMHSQHGLVLQDDELEMYMQWSLQDKPDAWEIERDKRIAAKQGNNNPYVQLYQQ